VRKTTKWIVSANDKLSNVL